MQGPLVHSLVLHGSIVSEKTFETPHVSSPEQFEDTKEVARSHQ
jgi:hypothetical protein